MYIRDRVDRSIIYPSANVNGTLFASFALYSGFSVLIPSNLILQCMGSLLQPLLRPFRSSDAILKVSNGVVFYAKGTHRTGLYCITPLCRMLS